ncbi:MAG: hypothetical protein ACR2G3_12805 [Solirubrobacterales bacterium]
MTERPDEAPSDDPRVDEEAEAAGREAAAIGGRARDEDIPEAERPLREAGQGEAEGFEIAEEDLVEHASHGDDGPDPTHMAGEPEEGTGPVGEYGEADDAQPDD